MHDNIFNCKTSHKKECTFSVSEPLKTFIMPHFILVLRFQDNSANWFVRNSNDNPQVLIDHPYYNPQVSHPIPKLQGDSNYQDVEAIDVRK